MDNKQTHISHFYAQIEGYEKDLDDSGIKFKKMKDPDFEKETGHNYLKKLKKMNDSFVIKPGKYKGDRKEGKGIGFKKKYAYGGRVAKYNKD